MASVLLTREQLQGMVPVSNMTLWRWIHDPKVSFPAPIRLNGGRNFWKLDQVEAWIEKRSAAQAAEPQAA